MTLETKLRLVLETYHNQISVLDSKAEIDRMKVIERNDLSTSQFYQALSEIAMDQVEQENLRQNEAISRIITIFKEEN